MRYSDIMITSSLILFLGLLSAFVTPQPQADLGGFWYESEVGNVKIKFPGPFEEKVEEEDAGVSYKVSSDIGEVKYFLTFLRHNTDLGLSDPMGLAEVSLESFVKATAGELVSSNSYSYKEHKGKEAKILLKEHGFELTYRVILIGQFQYQYMVLAPEGISPKKEVKNFFKSFELLD